MKRRNYWKKLASFAAILLLVLAVLYGGLRYLEDNVLKPEMSEEPAFSSRTITRNGIDYYPRRDLTVMMLLGTGSEQTTEDSENEQNELDAVMLLIFDEKNEAWNMLRLSCDTVLEIPVPDEDGRMSGTVCDRLALAYTYGSDSEARCVNTRRAVSDFLSGIGIDYYMAVDMDALNLLSDAQERTLDHLAEAYSAARNLVTDCPIQTLISMAARYQDYQFCGVITPEGETTAGEGSNQFHADAEKLEELVIELFYAPKRGQ